MNGGFLPSARLVSSQVGGRRQRLSGDFSMLLMVFGQFVDHDLTHVPVFDSGGEGIDCCSENGGFLQSTSVDTW